MPTPLSIEGLRRGIDSVVEKAKTLLPEKEVTVIRATRNGNVITLNAPVKNPELLNAIWYAEPDAQITFGSEKGYRPFRKNEVVIAKEAMGVDTMSNGTTAGGEYFKVVGGIMRMRQLSTFELRVEQK
jgi:hypothetical protein